MNDGVCLLGTQLLGETVTNTYDPFSTRWCPASVYWAPAALQEALVRDFQGDKDGVEAVTLFKFLARFNGHQNREFLIVKDGLKNREDLGLGESQIRRGRLALMRKGYVICHKPEKLFRESEKGTARRVHYTYTFPDFVKNWFRRAGEWLKRKLGFLSSTAPTVTVTVEEPVMQHSSENVARDNNTNWYKVSVSVGGSPPKMAPPTPVATKPTDDDPGLMAALARLGRGIISTKT